MFRVIRLRSIIIGCIVLIVVLGACFVSCKYVKASHISRLNYTIVVDAGHGGIDGGCVGASGITESEINLKVSQKLADMLKDFGFRVVMTRKGEDGLYSPLSSSKKQDDMKKRKEIIEKSKPNMVVSIHMNSFPSSHEHGAQSFYQKDSEESKQLADSIQNELCKNMYEARDFSNYADLYILKCTTSPSVVVEGGFLSNPKDEELLGGAEYQYKLAYSIFCGILKYYEGTHS